MEYLKICLVLGICVLLCGAVDQELELKLVPVEVLTAADNSQVDANASANANVDSTVVGARKVRQYFGAPPPFFGPPPPPYYGGGGGYGGYGGFGGGYGFQRTRVVTRTRYRGGYGGYGGGFGGFGGGYYG